MTENLGQAVLRSVKAGTFDRKAAHLNGTGYAQGNTKEQHDYQDGQRDAERVIEGLEPLRPLEQIATPDYVKGWKHAAEAIR